MTQNEQIEEQAGQEEEAARPIGVERLYQVALTGSMPILMHADNLDGQSIVEKWRKDPDNKDQVRGDDRSPAWSWLTYVYTDRNNIVIPDDIIRPCVMKAGARVPLNGKLTCKSLTQTGMQATDVFWTFFNHGKQIPMKALENLWSVRDFEKHQEQAKKLGFLLDVRRAAIGRSKHVRVRPMFSNWSVQGQILVNDDQLTDEMLKRIFSIAGRYVGICDWRPGSRTPGPYGTFSADLKQIS